MDTKKNTFNIYYRPNQTSSLSGTGRLQSTGVSVDSVGPTLKLIGGEFHHVHVPPKPFAAARRDSSPSKIYCATIRGPPSSSASFGASATSTPRFSDTKKAVYWDGLRHHIVDVPKNSRPSEWEAPHIRKEDLEQGHVLGARETPGSDGIRLVGGKYRFLPSLGGSRNVSSSIGTGAAIVPMPVAGNASGKLASGSNCPSISKP